MAEIQEVRIRHEAIMDFMIANPTVKQGDIAAKFGLTEAWLSQVIHSDAFQLMLRDKQDKIFHHTVLPLREKMTVAAHLGMDRLIERLPQETELEVLRKTSEGLLDRLGFSPKGNLNPAPGGVGGVVVNINLSELEQARQLLHNKRLGVTVDGESTAFCLPATDSSGLGQADQIATVPAVQTEREAG